MADMESSQQSTNSSGEEQWVPLVDYAVARGVSTSTLRRYIKAQKIRYKIENGRYLLLADSRIRPQKTPVWPKISDDMGNPRIRELEEKLFEAQEQISELKMLVAIYEEKLAQIAR